MINSSHILANDPARHQLLNQSVTFALSEEEGRNRYPREIVRQI